MELLLQFAVVKIGKGWKLNEIKIVDVSNLQTNVKFSHFIWQTCLNFIRVGNNVWLFFYVI